MCVWSHRIRRWHGKVSGELSLSADDSLQMTSNTLGRNSSNRAGRQRQRFRYSIASIRKCWVDIDASCKWYTQHENCWCDCCPTVSSLNTSTRMDWPVSIVDFLNSGSPSNSVSFRLNSTTRSIWFWNNENLLWMLRCRARHDWKVSLASSSRECGRKF